MADGEPTQYGRPDINACMDYLRSKVGPTLNGSDKTNRQDCRNLLAAMKKDYPGYDPVIAVKRLINLAMNDPWHKTRATSFNYLYWKKGDLILLGKPPQKPRSPYTVIMPGKNE